MRVVYVLAFAALSALSAGSALADPVCTTQPKSAWISEDAMKAKIAELGYQRIRTFKVAGSCYEIYGYDKDNKRAEVYFSPIDGSIVKE